MRISESDFKDLCDSFQNELDATESEEFLPDSGTVLTLGNKTWQVHLFASAVLEEPKQPLIHLFSSRRDLVRRVVDSRGIRDFLKSSYALAAWLEERGFSVGLEAKTPISKFQLFLFSKAADIFHFFSPH